MANPNPNGSTEHTPQTLTLLEQCPRHTFERTVMYQPSTSAAAVTTKNGDRQADPKPMHKKTRPKIIKTVSVYMPIPAHFFYWCYCTVEPSSLPPFLATVSTQRNDSLS